MGPSTPFCQETSVNITIGVRDSARELIMDVDMDRDELAGRVAAAIREGGVGGVLDLVDSKGQRCLIPAGAIGYVRMAEQVERRVGFAID